MGHDKTTFHVGRLAIITDTNSGMNLALETGNIYAIFADSIIDGIIDHKIKIASCKLQKLLLVSHSGESSKFKSCQLSPTSAAFNQYHTKLPQVDMINRLEFTFYPSSSHYGSTRHHLQVL